MPSTTIKANTRLNLFDFTMIMVSFVIGMGIFRTPVNVAKASIDPAGYLFAWLAGGGIALCGALTYAEIGSRYPVTGGYFKVFSLAYHPSIAFAINGIILISNASSVAAVALVGAEYISSIIFPTAQNLVITRAAIAIFCILLFYSINLLGLKMSAKTQNALMLIKIGLVLLLILPIFFSNRSFQETMMMKHQISPGLWEYLKAFGIGLVAVSFTYGGYQQVINFGEEVKEPSKTIPRAVFLGIGIIVVLYLLVNYAYLNIIGFEQLKNAENISA
ncbi:MAG TPA: amino acid permease, partial [Ferruginibacter sp.]|nr:amino acid permease [Ferruginibacter sp.]